MLAVQSAADQLCNPAMGSDVYTMQGH